MRHTTHLSPRFRWRLGAIHTHMFWYVPVFLALLIVGCSRDTPDPAAELHAETAQTRAWPAAPRIAPGTAVDRIVAAALAHNTPSSAEVGLFRQREAELRGVRRGRLPQIQPVATVNTSGDRAGGVDVSYPIADFGQRRAQINQATVAVELAELGIWIDRNTIAQDAIDSLISALTARALLQETETSLTQVRGLLALATDRVAAGAGDRSEIVLIELRISELQNQISSDQAAYNLAISQLGQLLGRAVPANAVPSTLDGVARALSRPANAPPHGPPPVLQADLERTVAQLRLEQAQAQRFPRVVVNATALNDSDGFSTQAGLGLDSSNLSVFSARANVEAAMSALSAAEAQLIRAQQDHESELNEIRLQRARLQSEIGALGALAAQSEQSVALFDNQREVGTRPLTDGITVFRTLLQAQRDLATARAEIVRLDLREIALSGLLATSGVEETAE